MCIVHMSAYICIVHMSAYICIMLKQLNRDPLNVTFHASVGHITIIRSITKNSNQRMSNIYPHDKQSKVMGGAKPPRTKDPLIDVNSAYSKNTTSS